MWNLSWFPEIHNSVDPPNSCYKGQIPFFLTHVVRQQTHVFDFQVQLLNKKITSRFKDHDFIALQLMRYKKRKTIC